MKDRFALIHVVWSDWETRNVADGLWMWKGESGRMEMELRWAPNEWGLINFKYRWMSNECLEAKKKEKLWYTPSVECFYLENKKWLDNKFSNIKIYQKYWTW